MNKEDLTVKYEIIVFLSAGVALAVLGGCSYLPAQLPGQQSVVKATLEPRSGSQVSGKVSFTPVGDKLLVEAHVTGLTPGEHGFHVHEAGDCSAPDASSAKGHFNPMSKAHGHHASDEHHGGDMPNLIANAQGEAKFTAELRGLSLSGPTGVVGRSVVIHADPDDYKSQPAGNSGKRVACGVIAAR